MRVELFYWDRLYEIFSSDSNSEEVLIDELYHSKAMAFEIFFCIYLMFRKVTVLSLQGGTETGLNREADDRAKTHIGKHFCPWVRTFMHHKISHKIPHRTVGYIVVQNCYHVFY